MATDAQVQAVRELLGPDASAGGWTDDRIKVDIDAGLHKYAIAEAWWRYRAASTANLVSISESGSTRDLRQIHTNAVSLADQYARLLAAATAVVEPTPETATRGITVHPIRRIGV